MTEVQRTDDEWHAHLKIEHDRGLADLFGKFRDRLRVAIDMRMDPQLYARVDPSDVIQESYVEAQARLPKYLAKPDMPPYLWIRFLTLQRLVTIYRKNVGVKARDARRDQSIDAQLIGAVSSEYIAAQLVDDGTTPSQAVVRIERRQRVQDAVEALDSTDREIIALRHFEQLSNREVALVLGLKPATSSQRYLRALRRLKEVLKRESDDSSKSL